MQLIIETDEEFAPIFRAVAKAVKAKVRTKAESKPSGPAPKQAPLIDEGVAAAGEKPSDFFRGAWANDPTRTAKSIREAAWRRKN